MLNADCLELSGLRAANRASAALLWFVFFPFGWVLETQRQTYGNKILKINNPKHVHCFVFLPIKNFLVNFSCSCICVDRGQRKKDE